MKAAAQRYPIWCSGCSPLHILATRQRSSCQYWVMASVPEEKHFLC